MKKKIIIFIAILLVIIIGCGIVFYVVSNKENEEESKKNINWGDAYLEILKNDSKYEDLTDPKMQLIDLNLDDIPELVFYGKNEEDSKYVAKVFEAKKSGTEEIKIELDDEFEFNYAKEISSKNEDWYVVSNSKTYKVNLENDEGIEENAIDLGNNYISVKSEEFLEIGDTAQEDFQNMKENYETEVNEMISTVDKNMEQAEFLQTLSLRDRTKNFVASAGKYPFTNPTMRYPYVNIANDKVYDVNRAISADFGFDSFNLEKNYEITEIELETYDWFINEKTLSIVCVKGGNDSTWSKSYNVNLENYEQIENSDLLKDIDLTDVKSKIIEYINNKLDEDLAEIESTYSADWHATSIEGWKKDLENNLNNIENIYLNEDGDVCIRVEYETFGGQEHCTKTLEVNVSKNTEPEEISYNDYLNGTREMVKTNVLYKAYSPVEPGKYDGEVVDLSKYFGKDLLETANELSFQASEATNTATGEKFVNSYVIPNHTSTRISDNYDPTGRIPNHYIQGKVNQIGIDGAVSELNHYTVYGLEAGMTFDECMEILKPMGIATQGRAGTFDYSVRFNDGSQVALNFRYGQDNELLSSYTFTVAPNN